MCVAAYRVDPEQARTDSRWLYLMAWKAATAKKAVRARRWDYHACITGKALISVNYRSYKQIPSPDLGPGVERTEKHPHDHDAREKLFLNVHPPDERK